MTIWFEGETKFNFKIMGRNSLYLNVIAILFLGFEFFLLALVSFRSGFKEVLVIAFVRVEPFGLEVDRVGGDGVEEFAVVTHHQQSFLPRLQVVLEPENGANLRIG